MENREGPCRMGAPLVRCELQVLHLHLTRQASDMSHVTGRVTGREAETYRIVALCSRRCRLE
jgi:hypothetical protein